MIALRRFLLGGEVAPVVLTSSLAVCLLAARIFATGRSEYSFLVWNLFLAWMPYVAAHAIRASHERRVRNVLLLPVFLVWLAFLPNAPYLVTDFIHLRWRQTGPLWFDAVMLASFAWAGIGLGAASLRMCTRVIRARHGRIAAAFVLPVAALGSGFGIYLGRFVRLNTWDVATRPSTVLGHVVSPFLHPIGNLDAWIVTATFACFFAVATLATGRPRAKLG